MNVYHYISGVHNFHMIVTANSQLEAINFVNKQLVNMPKWNHAWACEANTVQIPITGQNQMIYAGKFE